MKIENFTIGSGSREFHRGDKCWLNEGSTIIVVAKQENRPTLEYLVSYTTNTWDQGECPQGTLFSMGRHMFEEEKRFNAQKAADREARNKIVRDLLSRAVRTQGKLIERSVTVTVENPNGATSFQGHVRRQGARCFILPSSEGGSMLVVGQVEGETLYEFRADKDHGGSICSNGTLFFLNKTADK